MHLIVDIDIGGAALQRTAGPAEAAQQLRELANEIERKVVDFSVCREGQRLAGTDGGCAIAYLADL
ncbi:Cell division protein ZapA (plasmid) [Cupriavidus necator]|uniref:cell division protein ZapA n=1 Tax=Cupriavidus necator TaxID=106590 RepID=UPI003F735F9E